MVENGETGRGFSNEAYRGNLKITKDSSDGRRDGFAIEVKSADGSYCETFTTPKSGVVEIKGLRVGIYTVTEISNRASRAYIIPDAATVEIRADKTLLLMPGVAFDRYRNRIGYGKGFYDRFLAEFPELCLRSIAVGYQCQLLEELPSEETDIRPCQVICV